MNLCIAFKLVTCFWSTRRNGSCQTVHTSQHAQ